MSSPLPFLNFSLKKVMEREPDSFQRARIQIVYTLLVFSQIKMLVVIPLVIQHEQYLQLWRGIFLLLFCLGLIKYLLYRPDRTYIISHIILILGLAVIWSNLIFFVQSINLVTIQFVFTVTLCGFYLTERRLATMYSILAIFPVMLFLVTHDKNIWNVHITPQELASPGFEILIFLNFVTLVLSHYLFYRAFQHNLREKELLNQQLQAAVGDARALAESRAVFLSTMSHELRTPLNAVIGMTNLLHDSSTPEQKENLEILDFSAHSLLTLVNDILDYNKSENDKIELEAIPVDVSGLLHKICSGLKFQATEKGLALNLEVDKRLTGRLVVSDPTRFIQVIYNLAGNAIKFTKRGEVLMQAMVLEETESYIRTHFAITDTGIGIAAERQGAIFDPFTQASVDTTRNFGGTGLGLAIVKRLLKLFGSTIYLESEPGKGSVFSFTIDFKLFNGARDEEKQFNRAGNGLKNMKVLVAEDNQINARLMEKLLSRWEIQPVLAANGKEAVDKLLAGNFDVVLMDLHMPVMDGYDATLKIRALSDPVKAGVPIIALSASVSHNVHAKILAAGMQDYLPKPFQPDQLQEKLKRIGVAAE